MKTELLTTLDGTEKDLKEEWDNLVKISGNDVFSKYSFTKNVEKFYSDIAQPKIYLINLEDNLVGIAPLAEEEGILRFATGLDYKGIADYCDFIVHPQFREQIMSEFARVLQEHRFDLREIPQYSETIKYFQRERIGKIEDTKEPCSVLILPQTWEEYFNSLRGSYKKSLKKIKSDFPTLELKITTEESNLEKDLELFMQMHQEEWNARGLPGCFANDEKHSRFRNFHKELAKDLFKDNNLSILKLRDRDKIISIGYGFIDENIMYNYLGAINLEFKKYSPGRIIDLLWIKESINRGLKKFDFLRGYEEYKNDYKVNWSNNQTISNV